ncbi:MAG: hypothetical protein KAG72_10320 [Abyssibacter sp.]|nr:replication protein RepA [Abyssibacter sp.]MCK5859729.1 hypothetical protein [Abyssibacter sp.]
MASQPILVQSRHLDAAAGIASERAIGDDLSFVHVTWTQVVLPRAKWRQPDYYSRCGDAWVQVRAGSLNVNGEIKHTLVPSGAMARLALTQISTYVKRHRTLEVPIGRSAAEWARTIAASESSAHLRRAQETLMNIVAADLTMGWRGKTVYVRPVHAVSDWRLGHAGVAWPRSIQVSQDYVDTIVMNSVPLDHRVLLALRGSALAMDIYIWLAHRLHRVPRDGAMVPWPAIEQQFGAGRVNTIRDYRGPWRARFRRALSQATKYYGQGRVIECCGGLRLRYAAPHVSPKPSSVGCG